MMDVTALGEVLIDFTPAGRSAGGGALYEQNAGGAPANVMAALSRWGRSTAFIGKVGEDTFGRFLRGVLEERGLDTRGLIATAEANTTLAFVHLDEQGDRSFEFYRKPGADTLLLPHEVDRELIEDSRIFHFGSVSLTQEPAAGATLQAAAHARSTGRLVSYDPNLRMDLWPDADYARRQIRAGLALADVVKLSEEELEFISGTVDLEAGTGLLVQEYGTRLLLVTLGERGCFYRQGGQTGTAAGFDVQPVDTTGAGDTFFAGVLHGLLQSQTPPGELGEAELQEILRFANAAGALVTTRRGAIPALPELSEVLALTGGEQGQ